MEILHQGSVVPAIVAAIVAGLVTSVMVPLAAKMAVAIKAVDLPGGRKNHERAMPRLGGLAIGLGLLSGSGWVVLLTWRGWDSVVTLEALVALVMATSLVAMVGVGDDIIGVSPLKKLLVQTVAATLVVMIGWKFTAIGLPGGSTVELGSLSAFVTVLWIVGVTNAINLIDGLDGLATGVVAFIAGSFLVYSFAHQSPFAIILTAAIVGSCVGFLPYNREPASIFMGDAGSLTLGFLLGSMSVFSTLKSPAAVAILVPILALGVPVMDTGLVMLVRFLERPRGRFFRRFLRVLHADRNHLHDLLQEIVTTRRRAVNLIYAMVMVSCAMALVVALTKASNLGFLLVGVELAAVLLVRQLGFARQARALSQRKLQRIERGQWQRPEFESRDRQGHARATPGAVAPAGITDRADASLH